MEANYILVRFGELSTKGKNRKLFTAKLLKNAKEILADFPDLTYDLKHDRMYILLHGHDHEEVSKKVATIFGIYSFSVAYKVDRDLELVKEIVSKMINEDDKLTFKIQTKRADKNFPGTSNEINRELATHVFHHANRELKVDVRNPEMLIIVDIRVDAIYIMDNVKKGAGGYPVGVGGKALLMLSGGIDSPVAGYLTMKRGVDIECIHFASPPYTNQQARQKMLDLVDVMRQYTHGKINVHVIDFTKLQLAVYDHSDESYAMTVMRRMMYRISEQLAAKRDCLALVNGESIGQVASQTLHSMQAITEVVNIPILRPVLCLDKLEIIDIAKNIGTYEISIRPHEDCCTIFTPKAPATKPKAYKARGFEDAFDFEALVKECVETAELVVVDGTIDQDEDFF
ncbi:tRNA uracil 4-sulfurtransferase ThiI [Tannockella kyphosi]|uniref:tRNA uracil 4-sulfurtransferase ThiI n=1 Tax=Tannockella kyphosi TaxID=2899121 RepID=UPI00201349D9|nr:tRNA uracil 4-sulfurtransferase ThiI [Tannockella kyphosi]